MFLSKHILQLLEEALALFVVILFHAVLKSFQGFALGAGDLLPRPDENEGGHLMKLPCYLVQDLLPLYKDHVCDEQTSADVAEHLSDCAACSALLAEMDAPPQETAVQEEQAAVERHSPL